jgi:hypothetical protein
MSLITPTVEPFDSTSRNVLKATWVGVGDADTCAPIALPDYPDRSIQVSGTFGGATIAWKGSNNGVDYSALKDTDGTDIAITGTDLVQVNDLAGYSKPLTSGGTNSKVSITMIARKGG